MNSSTVESNGAEQGNGDVHVITAVISADRPLSADLVASVTAVARRAEDTTPELRQCVVLYIDGARSDEYFAWPGDVAVADVGKWESALRRLEQVPAPIIAVVSGAAYGPAAELLLVADYRIVRAGATFGLARTGAGVWPAMALYRLAGQAGLGRARELAIHGRTLSAEVAREHGLVDQVITEGGEAAAITAAVALFGASVGAELAIRRRLLLDAATTRFEDALGAHLAASDRMLRRERAAS